ncbi:HAD family hydrolase, partial [archaeon]
MVGNVVYDQGVSSFTPATSIDTIERQLLAYLTPGIYCNDAVLRLGDQKVGYRESRESQDEEKELSVTDETQRRDTDIELGTMDSDYKFIGDATETCLLKVAVQLSRNAKDVKDMRKKHKRLQEIPFDSSTKYMATLHLLPTSLLASMQSNREPYASPYRYAIMMKGAPERVLQFTKQVNKEMWLSKSETLARQGMRVLAFAFKVLSTAYTTENRSLLDEIHHHAGEFTLICLVGIMDPPRPEAIEAVRCAQEAGITVKMITGDHPGTAKAIGQMLGLRLSDRVIIGRELDQHMDELDRIVREYDIFARTTPEHKLRIVQSLQSQDNICSMTGDGVNDAPALKAANMGVAMGIAGTEVAKDAAAMIITDDNFATIVQAIKVGRSTYRNLIKTLVFVLPTNGGQAMSVIIA